MKTAQNKTFQAGQTLIYNDGRAGHTCARCVVLSSNEFSMLVQFEDRPDTTAIRFSDAEWVKHLTVAN